MADISKKFDAYNKHLNLIRELKITEREDEYICPICLCGYKKSDIDQLSLEDAPQEALGGKKIAITCKKCNNTCGNTIDYHLVNYIDITERRQFLPETKHKIRIEGLGEGKPIGATLRINSQNKMELLVPKDYYNSSKHRERLDMLKKDQIITVQNKKIKIDHNLLSSAVFKNAYIILFSRFGYTFMLDDYYGILRRKIQGEKITSSPFGLYSICGNLPIVDGVYFSCDNRYRGFFVAYTVTRIISHRIFVYIPTPSANPHIAIETIKKAESNEGLCLKEFNDPNLLWDKNKIESLRNWVYSKEQN